MVGACRPRMNLWTSEQPSTQMVHWWPPWTWKRRMNRSARSPTSSMQSTTTMLGHMPWHARQLYNARASMLGHMPWHARQLYNARSYALAYYIMGRYVMLVRHSRQTYGARAYALAHTMNPNLMYVQSTSAFFFAPTQSSHRAG